jgi:hypothetical protein
MLLEVGPVHVYLDQSLRLAPYLTAAPYLTNAIFTTHFSSDIACNIKGLISNFFIIKQLFRAVNSAAWSNQLLHRRSKIGLVV